MPAPAAPDSPATAGPPRAPQLRQPHSIAVDRARRGCSSATSATIAFARSTSPPASSTTFAGTGERQPTPDGAPLQGAPLNGPRTIAIDGDGNLYLALREGNAIYRIDGQTVDRCIMSPAPASRATAGDGGPAALATLAGPKGLAWSRGPLYVADTENHVDPRDRPDTGIIRTVLGTGQRGDGPETDPLAARCRGRTACCVDARGVLYVGDSEAHRIRTVA